MSAGDRPPPGDGPTRDEAAEPELLLVRPPLVDACPAEAAPRPLRVASWNMRAARSAPLEEVAAVIASMDADVVALQEVDVGVRRTGAVDQPARLALELDYAYAFAASVEYMGGDYGLSLLSRVPVRRVERIRLDAEGAYEPRIALDATLCVGASTLRLINHHADIYPAVAVRNLRELLTAIEPSIGRGLLLVGDLNQPPDAEGPALLAAAGLSDLMAGRGEPTRGGLRIDYVFADTRAAAWAGTVRVVETEASDHAALYVDLTPP